VQFLTKCPEINCLHDKGQHVNAAVKNIFGFAVGKWNYLKTKLTATF